MERVYAKSSKCTDVQLFVGTEVEHTAAFGQRTLFVVGKQDPSRLIAIAKENNCTHVYFGANMSFDADTDDFDQWGWEAMVKTVLKSDFWVTLDFQPTKAAQDWLGDSGLTEYRRFIAMVSVRLPYVRHLGYHACIKLDDYTFDYSNPGVWVHPVRDLMTADTFTDWDQYTSDKPL